MPGTKLTKRAVDALKPDSRPVVFYDAELRGFGVRVMPSGSKSWVVEYRPGAGGRGVAKKRLTLGSTGTLTADEARGAARDILARVRLGGDPLADRKGIRNATTLRAAWQRYREGHLDRRGRSQSTLANYRDHIERLLADWLDKPLLALSSDPRLITARHEAITRDRGPYMANAAMRTLRAVYNHARKADRSLPADNPVAAVDWNKEERRQTGIGSANLPAWFKQLAAIGNPIRREFHLFTLLSGSRPDALSKARLDHLDLRRRVLNIPNPKGGEKRAFDIPLSRPMVRCLIRAIRAGRMMHPDQATIWIFPAASASGHLAEQKESRATLTHWGNDLRQSYRTIAQEAGLSELDARLLMNHAVVGVNAGYLTRGRLLQHLREQQARVSDRICRSSELARHVCSSRSDLTAR